MGRFQPSVVVKSITLVLPLAEGVVLSMTGNLLATGIFSIVQFGDAVTSLMMLLVVLTPPASTVLQSQ